MVSLGLAAQRLGRLTEAIEYYERSLTLDRELKDRYYEAHALEHLADALQETGRHDEALEALRDALGILDALEHPDADRVRARLGRG